MHKICKSLTPNTDEQFLLADIVGRQKMPEKKCPILTFTRLIFIAQLLLAHEQKMADSTISPSFLFLSSLIF